MVYFFMVFLMLGAVEKRSRFSAILDLAVYAFIDLMTKGSVDVPSLLSSKTPNWNHTYQFKMRLQHVYCRFSG